MIKFGVVTLLTLLPPFLAFHFLHADGPLLLLILYALLVEALFFLRSRTGGSMRPAATGLLALLLAGGALVIVVGLNITPLSAYLAWFRLVGEGAEGGTLAYMFAIKYAFFSSLFAGMLFTARPRLPLSGYLFMTALITAVVLESTVLALAAVAIIPIGLIAPTRPAAWRRKLRGLVPVAEVVGAAFLIALPFSIAPANNRLIDALYSLDPSGLVAEMFPNFPFLYNVPGYGHSFSSSELGARPALTSRPVYEVTAQPGSTIYLRTTVYDTYDGRGWTLSARPEREGGIAAKGEIAPSMLRPGSGTTSVRIGRGDSRVAPSASRTIDIKLLIDFSSAIPHTLDTDLVRTNTAALPPFTFAGQNTGYILSLPLVRGTRIVDALAPTRERETEALPPAERAADLQLDRLPESVVQLAHRLDEPGNAPATLRAIRSFLDTNYAYSLDTTAASRDTDTVADFLFHSRTGYCVQFATAFVVLARLDGIPARYATGFLVNMPAGSDTTTVSGLDAHSWAEVWLPGRGWTTEEATPPMQSASFDDPSYYDRFNPTDSSYTQRQLMSLMGNRVPPPQAERPSGRMIPWLALGAGGAAAAAAILLARLLALAFASRGAKARRIIGKIARRSLQLDLPDPARAGWLGWARGASALRRQRRHALARAASIIQLLFFAGRPARRRDIRFLQSVYRGALQKGHARGGRAGSLPESASPADSPPLYSPSAFK